MASSARQARKRAHSSSDDDDAGVAPSAAARPTLPNKRVLAATSFSSRARTTGAETSIVAELDGVASGAGSKRQVAGGAFATSEIDTELDRDGRALYEKQMALQEIARSVVVSDKKLYRGQAGYTNFIQKDAAEAASRSKVTGSHGPLRAPSNVRGILRMDYAPDICKDYKETGYCGFGDSCKFLHDRGDYKMGWQIEKEYDEQQKKKAAARAARAAAGGDPDAEDTDNPFLIKEEEEDADGLPFACHLCREPFRSPIQTLCGHYFCEECAVRHFATSQACAICAKPTNGIFNPALKLIARLKATAAAAAAAAEEEEGAELEPAPAAPAAAAALRAPADSGAGSLASRRAARAAASGWEVVTEESESAPAASPSVGASGAPPAAAASEPRH